MKDLILLASLTEGPKHGYQLKKEAGAIFSGGELHNNSVYPLLHRFQRNGWVRRQSLPGERGQKRFRYSLTRRGFTALVRRLSEEDRGKRDRDEMFYLRVALFPILRPKVRRRVLEDRQKQLEGKQERIESIQQQFHELGSYPGEVLRFLGQETQVELGWIQHLLAVERNRSYGQRARPGTPLVIGQAIEETRDGGVGL